MRPTGNQAARTVALLGLLALCGLYVLSGSASARVRPSTTVPGAAPGGHVVTGRHVDRLAASNQGSITAEVGVQAVDGKAALWVKVYANSHEVAARFSRLHLQELGYDRQGHRYVVRQYTATAARGPTHRTAGGRVVYYRGKFRPIDPRTVSFRVGVRVQAHKSGTWLQTRHPRAKCVASFEVVRRDGRVLAGPLC